MEIDPEAIGEVMLTVTAAETAARLAVEAGEAYPEVFATGVLALFFSRLGLVRTQSATRAFLASTAIFLLGGIPGTFHHLYFSGTPVSVRRSWMKRNSSSCLRVNIDQVPRVRWSTRPPDVRNKS